VSTYWGPLIEFSRKLLMEERSEPWYYRTSTGASGVAAPAFCPTVKGAESSRNDQNDRRRDGKKNDGTFCPVVHTGEPACRKMKDRIGTLSRFFRKGRKGDAFTIRGSPGLPRGEILLFPKRPLIRLYTPGCTLIIRISFSCVI
jgi:hypothetical protein